MLMDGDGNGCSVLFTSGQLVFFGHFIAWQIFRYSRFSVLGALVPWFWEFKVPVDYIWLVRRQICRGWGMR